MSEWRSLSVEETLRAGALGRLPVGDRSASGARSSIHHCAKKIGVRVQTWTVVIDEDLSVLFRRKEEGDE